MRCAQVPELNVQNGVLKALSFLFEYIGEMGKDYIYAVSPLLEDALMDRDLVRMRARLFWLAHLSWLAPLCPPAAWFPAKGLPGVGIHATRLKRGASGRANSPSSAGAKITCC
jgi:hypothetical protein